VVGIDPAGGDPCILSAKDDGISLTREMIRIFGEGKEP